VSTLSPLRLGTAWARISGLMDEAAESFVRTSFSSVVRDNWDMAVGLMDSAGRQFAQSSRSVPSFVGTMPRTLAVMLRRHPAETLRPGDVLISNDGYDGTGHLNDITTIKPVFLGGRLAAWIGSTFHATDIGGAPSVEARDSWEEGLTIPVCRILRGGQENEDVFAFLQANLRQPEEVLGDLRAQFAMYEAAEARLGRILAEEAIAAPDALAKEIFFRSERAMRAAIAAVPDGEVTDAVTADGFEHPVTIRLRLEIRGEDLTLDFTGTDPQIARPVNSPLNFTRAYSNYAVKCAFDPATPNNDGSFRPITLVAPEGCIVNPCRPAPVWGRHLTGHYLPMLVLAALGKILPERVIAESGGPLWNVYFTGEHAGGRRFVRMFFMNGGQGAAAAHDGPSCLSFPSNVATQPVEAFENAVPMLVTEKALISGSGGTGRHRGGLGQRIGFRVLGERPVTATFRHERVRHPPRGLHGGQPGRGGRDVVNGTPVPSKARVVLDPGDTITFETPGGGGFGPAEDRDPAAVERDRREGYADG
jgi:N-methylhydantoinase B